MYATLYFGIFELELILSYSNTLHLYKCYIDDVFGIWILHPDPETNDVNWTTFQAAINSCGNLEWEFSALEKTIPFMDLDLYIQVHTLLMEICASQVGTV